LARDEKRRRAAAFFQIQPKIFDRRARFLMRSVINMVKLPGPARIQMETFGQKNFEAAPVRDIGDAGVIR
jgi:hypothetical protein